MPAHVEIDLHAGLRGGVERADAAAVDERVHLHRDPRRAAFAVRLDRALDLGDDPVAQHVGRRQHPPVVQRAPVAGQVVEHVGDVGADLLVDGEQAEVGVQARGRGVVVAGADVHVVAHPVALAAHDEHALGVGLHRGLAVDDVHARLLQRLRPVDVHALVEARLQLDQRDRLLAALGGFDQRRHQRRVVARAVDGLLDREHVGVGDGLLDEALDRGRERVVGVVDEHVAFAHRAEHVGALALVADQAGDGSRTAAAPRAAPRGPASSRSATARPCRAARRPGRPPRPRRRAGPSARCAAARRCRRRPRPARSRRSAGGAARPRPPAAGRRRRRRPRGRRRA